MGSTRGRQKLIRSAALALIAWLVAVIAAILWLRPEFWVHPHDRFERAKVLADQGRPADAIAWIDRALADEPNNAGYLVFRGYRQLDLADVVHAEQSFRRALESDAANLEARLGLGTALTRQNRQEAAFSVLQPLSADTISADQLRRRSQLYAMLGARGPALDDLSQLLQHQPANPELLKEAAALAFALEDWARAASFAFRLGAATPDPDLRRWAADTRAVALHSSGRIAEAYESYREGSNPDRLEIRAQLALKLGRYGEAAELYETLANEHPAEARFRRSLAYALHVAGRRRAAENVFRRLIATRDADTATRQMYAWLLNMQQRHAEAWKVVEPLPRPARDLELLELQARTAIWAGQTAEAVQLIRALLAVRPLDAELWKRLADAWSALGNDRQAADALRTYVRLQSQDLPARQRLAEILAQLGSLEEAIEEYRTLVAASPKNPELLRSLGLLQETAGQLEAATGTYLRAVKQASSANPDLYLRLGRLHRWTSQPGAAVPWYERYLAAATDPVLLRTAEAELALSLLESGDPAASLARLQAVSARVALDAAELLTAARAATANGQFAAAARFLELLGERRELSREEQVWLADQYRAAGMSDRALATYERAMLTGQHPDPRVLEAIADLRFDLGDFHGALRALQQIGEATDVSLKMARSASRAGELAIASEAYQRYVRAHADDVEGRLEAARYHAGAGRPQIAIAYYRDVVAARGANDLRLELARVHLAAEQFTAAEQWARQASAAGEDRDESGLALAQSLHLQGREREADAVLRDLVDRTPNLAEGLVWRGEVAMALDRHLDAYRTFDQAIAAGSGGRDRLLLSMATAARKRDDYRRAAAHARRAATEGANPPQAEAARQELRALTMPRLYVPVWVHTDTNDLRLAQTGGGLVLFLPSLSGALSFEVSRGVVSQRRFSADRTSATLTVGQLFPVPELKLDFGVGLDHYDRARDLFTWRALGTYYFQNDSIVGLIVSREPLLPVDTRPELRRFNRVLDVALLGPGFHIEALRGFADVFMPGYRRAKVEAGIERMQDANRRIFSYIHYQLPVATGPRRWTVVRPNLFYETFRDKNLAYFSPTSHFTLGAMLHTIRQYPRWILELEANPQLLRTEGSSGFGIHGLLNVGFTLGRTSIGAGTFVFYDGLEDYLQWRLGGRVSIPLGR